LKIHVAIVSDQILANLIPALMEKPDAVWLVSSLAMSARGVDSRLARLLKKAGMAVEIRNAAPEVNMRAIYAFAASVIDELMEKHAAAELILNATGGTKPMSLGFIEVFRGIAARIIYTDTPHRQIDVLPQGREDAAVPTPMFDVLDVPGYLSAQGLRYAEADSDAAPYVTRMQGRKAAAKHLGRNAVKLEALFRTMNALADRALDRDGNLVDPMQRFNTPHPPRGDWAAALHALIDAKCISWSTGSNDIAFIDAERTQFVRGGWLEEYAFHLVRDERPFDVRKGVKVQMEGGDGVTNEFDVVACHLNQLLFLECKTLKFEEGRNDSDVAYKLESLGDRARGLFGETWLLSAQTPTPLLRKRAEQGRFRLLGPADLPVLRERVRAWIEGA